MGLKIILQATFPASVSLANSGILKRPDIVDAAGGFLNVFLLMSRQSLIPVKFLPAASQRLAPLHINS
jgi:hypothetical protein